MSDSVYFEGDPATDSARRHLERVLKAPETKSRWPWILAALASGGVWWVWHGSHAAARVKKTSGSEPEAGEQQTRR